MRRVKSVTFTPAAKRHRHAWHALYWHFGPYGPQDVHVHPCMRDECERVMIGDGRECSLKAEHRRVRLVEDTPASELARRDRRTNNLSSGDE
jgi:hypothetical protein